MKKIWLALLLSLVLAACSGGTSTEDDGGDEGSTQSVSCSPDTSPATLKAKDSKFDAECLAAKADEAFTVDFVNEDSFPHNVSIYKDKDASDELFKGDNVNGGEKTTYNVTAQSAGKYYFRCDIHPDMDGTFVVAGT